MPKLYKITDITREFLFDHVDPPPFTSTMIMYNTLRNVDYLYQKDESSFYFVDKNLKMVYWVNQLTDEQIAFKWDVNKKMLRRLKRKTEEVDDDPAIAKIELLYG
jgi:hypothetical protein